MLKEKGPGAVPFLTSRSARMVVSLSRKEFANGTGVAGFVLLVLVFSSVNSGYCVSDCRQGKLVR